MSDIKFILAQVFQEDLIRAGMLCAGPGQKIPVSSDQIVYGEEWFTPFVENGMFDRYDRTIQTAQPTTDSIRTVRMRNPDSGATQWVLGTQLDWIDRVNACCGTTPEMPDVLLPDPLLEEFPCAIQICTPGAFNYTYTDVFPVLAAGQRYLLAGSANGVAFTPAAPGAGFATMATALAWAQANWGAYGTWTATDTDGLTLVTTTGTRGNVSIRILPAP